MPALLTRMSSRPDDLRVFSIISRMSAGFDMSAGEYDTRTLKSEAIFACASATSSGLPKPLRTISDPAAAKARAMPRPIPLVDPVTSDTLPASASRTLIFSGLMAMVMARRLLVGGADLLLFSGANLPEAADAAPMPIG
jgi:hypothetical protein